MKHLGVCIIIHMILQGACYSTCIPLPQDIEICSSDVRDSSLFVDQPSESDLEGSKPPGYIQSYVAKCGNHRG